MCTPSHPTLTGEHMHNISNDPTDPLPVRVDFERPFVTPPKVVAFLNYIELDKSRNWSLMVVTGRTLHNILHGG